MRAGDWRAPGRVPSTKGSHFVQEKKLLGFLGRLEGRCRGWFYRAFLSPAVAFTVAGSKQARSISGRPELRLDDPDDMLRWVRG